MHHAHPRARIDALTGRSSPPNGHVMCNILLLIGYVAWHPRHTDRRRHARRSCRTRLHDEVRPSLLAEPRASQCPVHSHCASALGLARAGCIHSAGVLQLQHSWTSSARPAASTWGGSAWTLQLARGKGGPDRRKPSRSDEAGSKLHVAGDAGGLPISVVLSPANDLPPGWVGHPHSRGYPKSGVRARLSREAGGTPT
jgi:hypothetical protein